MPLSPVGIGRELGIYGTFSLSSARALFKAEGLYRSTSLGSSFGPVSEIPVTLPKPQLKNGGNSRLRGLDPPRLQAAMGQRVCLTAH